MFVLAIGESPKVIKLCYTMPLMHPSFVTTCIVQIGFDVVRNVPQQ